MKTAISDCKHKAAQCGLSLSRSTDPVPVKCDVIQDWNTDELVWVSADEEARELQRRKMTPEERQPSLFREPPK